MAKFILRPKIDTDHSDNYAPNAVRSDPTKDWWEHIFGSDDGLYIWTPAENKLFSATTSALIDENDLPSVSSADGKMTSLIVFARGKATGTGTFELYASLHPYMTARLEIPPDGSWYTQSGAFDIGAHNQLNELHDLEIGGGCRSKNNNYWGYKYLDYVYCEIDYVPAPPTISWQWIYKLDEGNLAAFNANHMYSTFLKEWGFEIRLKATGEIIKTVTWTGRKLQGQSWLTELTYPDLNYGTTYEARGYGITDDGKGVGAWVEFTTRVAPATIKNIKATKSAGHLNLYGEITNITGPTIVERGFEYLVRDSEPGIEDTGTEVKETGGPFIEEGYNLSSWGTFNDLYRAEENKIWWFRAYCLDDAETPNKYTAATWMKNVPTILTYDGPVVYAQEATAKGELLDLGANIVTLKGFRIIKEYRGDLSGAWSYHSDGFEGELEREKVYNNEGKLIGFTWIGELHRDSFIENSGGFELGIYEMDLGGGFSGEGFGIYLKPNDTYRIRAIAENQLGIGFGNDGYIYTYNRLEAGNQGKGDEGKINIGEPWEEDGNGIWWKTGNILQEDDIIETGQLILPSDDENVSEISAEKTITLGTIPYGATVTRIGIRLGRTMGCNEIHVFEDGTWGTGGSHTFYITDFVPGATYYKMPYIVINYGDYEEEVLAIPDYRNPERLEEWLTDYPIEVFPEVEDEDIDITVTDSSVGDISYRTIIREIECERIADQSFIDMAGRRRSQTVNNHLIQSRANCKIIVDDYIEKFQMVKLKILIDYDIPIPFEREDVILLGDGKVKYQGNGGGLIAFKATGEGELLQQDFILAKIRKMDGRYIAGTEAILNLELEV